MSESHSGSYSCGTGSLLQDSNDTGFSEHELLNLMYSKCDASNTGAVLASCIMHYLETLTARSAEEDRLASLRQLLDPDLQDPLVSRNTFLSTMKSWIAQCSQQSSESDIICLPWPDYTETPVNAPPEVHHFSCERQDLSGVLTDLKQAHQKLSQQNSSLLRMLAQCEDENLQLSLEIIELQTKLVSSERSSIKAQCLTEELEETHQTLKEVQETASYTHRRLTQLTNETENLRAQIRVLEDKNEKLTFEMACYDETVNKLRRINTQLRAEHEETVNLMMLKDKEITKKSILMDKMRNFHVENHNMIEDLRSELMRLQEHSHQQLLRFDRHCLTSRSPHSSDPPNQHSLQSEIQDMQQCLSYSSQQMS
ncbi:inositol 1,4,5-triphosphate receptor associated 2-like [Cyprinodon tularosa]|uniref:inositol 1,4,5-triphosphate receptor associated 2-like n=1 Tax=Cyprinodon tularosa TaxID=77115 RepID=UPI0018E28029|nr:inositol 1,4,5-triphosphate receptor associated 2-like [Cyprinodon tularosa]